MHAKGNRLVELRVHNRTHRTPGMNCLVLRTEEEVVGRIRHKNLVAHIAGN